MKQNYIKRAGALVSALALCAGLTACGGGEDKTAEKFLTAVQTQDFTTAMTCMSEGNRLNHVFAAVDGTSIPELDEVYRTFAKQMSEMTFEIVGPGEESGTFNVRIQSRDYDAAICEAMNAAIRAQVEEGGDPFSNYAGWLSQGVSQAAMGEEGEEVMTVSKENGGKIDTIESWDFFDRLTGGFYDYADLTMTTCTLANEEQESTYYIASRGDYVIGCIMVDAITLDLSGATEEDVALLVEAAEQELRGMKGIYGKVEAEDGKFSTTVGIDFNEVEQVNLIKMGLIEGSRGYNEHLSLETTIEGFESQGMTCVTAPQYA